MVKKCCFSIAALITASGWPTTYARPSSKKLDALSLHTTSTWREYCLQPQKKVVISDEKWAWTCSLVVRSKQPRMLSLIVLQWNGKSIENLSASLYQKKERDKVLKPIQENLVCDGSWNSQLQQLTFKLYEKVVAINKYHLVISFPNFVENKIKKGAFTIAQTQSTLIKSNKE